MEDAGLGLMGLPLATGAWEDVYPGGGGYVGGGGWSTWYCFELVDGWGS